MTPDQEPWDLQLSEAKRAYHDLGPSEAQLGRMLRAIEAPVLGPPRAAPAAMKVAKLVVLALGVTVLGVWLSLRQPEPRPQPPALPLIPRVERLPITDPWPSPVPSRREDVPPQQEVEAPVIETKKPSMTPRAKRAGETEKQTRGGVAGLTDELALLSRARRILARDPERALSLAQTHARDYPLGVFAEERELLAVEALLAADRRAEAERRAIRFARTHPSSVHAHRMRVLLEEPSDRLGRSPFR